MSAPLSATAFLNALRAEGLTVVEVGSWKTHTRTSASRLWGPVNGVLVHHTVTKGTQNSVSICRTGYTSLPGPLCHGVIGKDGVVYLVGYGRTNHAGGGDPGVFATVRDESYGTTPPATHYGEGDDGALDGNQHFYGFECENLGDGKDPWPAKQVESIVRATAAVCRAHGWGNKSVIGHLEWSNQKSDPHGFAMPAIRARIAERLQHTSSWTPGGNTTYTVAKGDTLSSIAKAKLGDAGRYPEIVTLNKLANANAIKVGQVLKLPPK